VTGNRYPKDGENIQEVLNTAKTDKAAKINLINGLERKSETEAIYKEVYVNKVKRFLDPAKFFSAFKDLSRDSKQWFGLDVFARRLSINVYVYVLLLGTLFMLIPRIRKWISRLRNKNVNSLSTKTLCPNLL